MKFELEERPQEVLLKNGYKPRGGSEFQFRKDISNKSYFHAIIEYNHFIVNLHIDTEIKGHTKKGYNHTTQHFGPQVRNERLKIVRSTFAGRLDLVKMKIFSLLMNDNYKSR